jgi:hypothetical protein
VLNITAGFDSVVVTQVLDSYSCVATDAPSLSEQDDPTDDDSDMLGPSAPPLRRGERKQERPLPGSAEDDRAGRRFLSHLALLRGRPCRAGCEHANRNGLGFPLLC